MNKQEIPLFKVAMASTAAVEVAKVLNSGYIGQGPMVEKYEKLLEQRYGNKNIVTVNSATSGIHLLLHLLKLSGFQIDNPSYHNPFIYTNEIEVLCTPLTCTASNWPVLANGLKIKWVDVDKNTLNMDLEDLRRKLSINTKVIILVHWGGYPNYMAQIEEIKNECFQMYGFKPIIIEDCAHAFGSTIGGRNVGDTGNISIFSTQAIKHLTTGDGGFIIFPRGMAWMSDKAKLLRWYGIDREGERTDFRCEGDISDWGFKFHMNDINAAIGIENLKEVDTNVQKHKENAAFYDSELAGINELQLTTRDSGLDSSFWIYSLLVERKAEFMKHMKAHGIATSQVHERNDKHSTVKKYVSSLPNLNYIIPRLVHIPVGWWVGESERSYIVDVIRSGW